MQELLSLLSEVSEIQDRTLNMRADEPDAEPDCDFVDEFADAGQTVWI